MTEKETEEVEAKKSKKPSGEIEEKRIKPRVIRRRAKKAAPKVEPEKAPEVAEAASVEEATESAPQAVSEAAPVAEAATAVEAEATETTSVEAATPPKEKKAGKKAAKKAEATKAKEEQPEEAAKPSKKGKGAGAKKEVKVFGAQPPNKIFTPTAQAFKIGKRRRVRPQSRPRQRKPQGLQPTRALMKTEVTTPKAAKRVIRIVDAISVADLSQRIGVKGNEIIRKLMELGIMSTVNQLIDRDTAAVVAADFDYEVESAGPQEDVLMGSDVEVEEGVEIASRPPVVTVMGHVDHGKTSLLDAIRETNVATGEAGGITQHIGAYHVHLDKGDVTFLDTPGHEAFTAMRARGARVTDIVVLVVAADDGVKPQTKEAINHAKEAGVPIIVAINKMDLPGADPTRVRQELSEHELLSEDWGGETLFIEVSAKNGTNIKELLELILLQADMLELKSAVDSPARGVIVEAKLDKGRGPVATVLIRGGTVHSGDAFVTGGISGRVRAMISDWGKKIKSAGPSMPVEILGLPGVPFVGDDFTVVKDEATAKQIAAIRVKKFADMGETKSAKVSLTELYDQMTRGELKELKVIIKGDVQGSIEAVKDALEKLSTEAISLVPIHTGAGAISEGDCMLASASNAIIIGFNVRPEVKATALAEKEKIDLRQYSVIYDLVEDIKNAMEGMLAPIITEEVTGRVEVREVIRISKVGNIAGSFVVDGTVKRNSKARLVRDDVLIYDGKIGSLKRFKEDAKEVASGYECGVGFEGYNDIKVGDIIEVYELKEEAAKL